MPSAYKGGFLRRMARFSASLRRRLRAFGFKTMAWISDARHEFSPNDLNRSKRSKLRTGIEAERWGQKYVWNRCFGPRDQGPDGTGPYRSELRLAVDRCGFEDVETAGMV